MLMVASLPQTILMVASLPPKTMLLVASLPPNNANGCLRSPPNNVNGCLPAPQTMLMVASLPMYWLFGFMQPSGRVDPLSSCYIYNASLDKHQLLLGRYLSDKKHLFRVGTIRLGESWNVLQCVGSQQAGYTATNTTHTIPPSKTPARQNTAQSSY